MPFQKQRGDPRPWPRRYRQDSPSLTIGWELIGPELFPMYLIILSVNLVITLACVTIVFLILHAPIRVDVFVFPVVIQIIVVTLVFIGLNLVRRKYPQPWYYPPAELSPMIPIPRAYSVAGLLLWTPVLFWCLSLPHFPSLISGSAAAHLQLAPAWHTFYMPLLLVLLAST